MAFTTIPRTALLWVAPLAASVLVAFVATELRGEDLEAQPMQASPTAERLHEEDFAKRMGPPDPFNRGTSRGSVYGFALACRKGDYE